MTLSLKWVPLAELICGCQPSAAGIYACPKHYRSEQLHQAVLRLLPYAPPEATMTLGVRKLLELVDGPAA